MTRPEKFIGALAAKLGNARGLERVVREIGELCNSIMGGRARLSCADLTEVQKSLEMLGRMISTIDGAVRRRIAALAADT